MKKLIVSRHPAAIQFIAAELGGEVDGSVVRIHPPGNGKEAEVIPILGQATAEDIRGQVVYGNLPMQLAALCASVYAVEFSGPPPRGAEYNVEDMKRAGCRLVRYKVLTEERVKDIQQAAHQDGYGPDPAFLISMDS